jgi:hypothetical protein
MQKHINMAQIANILSFIFVLMRAKTTIFFEVLAVIQLPNLEKFMQFGK